MKEYGTSDLLIKESQARRIGLVRELWDFLKHNKKWWLAPLMIVFFALGSLTLLGGTAVAPFIYTLF